VPPAWIRLRTLVDLDGKDHRAGGRISPQDAKEARTHHYCLAFLALLRTSVR
jgi:hypothetical protein